MAYKKSKKGAAIRRWLKEDWRTPSGDKDYSGGDTTFRPTKRVSEDTPTTWSELTPAEKARAEKEKKTKGRVSRYEKEEYGGEPVYNHMGMRVPGMFKK